MQRFKSTFALLLMFVLLLSACQPLVAPEVVAPAEEAALDPALISEIEALIEQTMEEAQIPGVALGVVKNGEFAYAEGFGVTELGGEAPVTPASIFHLASIGKTAVGLAILQLVEEGKIDLDATVTEYLPYFTLADPEAQDITIRQLLSHTGGVSDIEDWIVEWRDKEVRTDDDALEEYVKSLSGDSLIFKPGEDWSYSSIGFDILGDVIAKASGQPFEEYVQDHLFSPLDMENTSFLLEDIDMELLASPHMYDENGAVEKIDFFPYSRIHSPSSTLYSSVEDMARYAMANMNQGELDGVQILPSSTYVDMWSPYVSTSWAEWGGPLLVNYGLGWWVGESTGGPAIGGYGADPGFQSHLTMIPQDGMAIIVMTNLFDPEEGSLRAFEIGDAVMEILLEKE